MSETKQPEVIVQLKATRLSFPNLFKAAQVNGEGEFTYNGNFLLTPENPSLKVLKAKILEVAKAKWGAKGEAMYKQLVAADKTCLHDGNGKPQYDDYPGNFYVSARSKARPTVVDKDRSPLTEDDGRPYGGCYVTVSIGLWAQDNKWGRRINATLRGVQFERDGERFGGGSIAKPDEFEDISESPDADAGDASDLT